jgi:hypothetical protein
MHQPLHASDNNDAGGNKVLVTVDSFPHRAKDELHGFCGIHLPATLRVEVGLRSHSDGRLLAVRSTLSRSQRCAGSLSSHRGHIIVVVTTGEVNGRSWNAKGR